MTPVDPSLVSGVRIASRDLVRLWGFLGRTVAGTGLSASAVHAIIEIGQEDGPTARDLSARLRLEKSTVSRLIRSLVDAGEVRETPASDDARMKRLHLTDRGRRTLQQADSFAAAQVTGALARFDRSRQQAICRGLTDYAGALRETAGDESRAAPAIVVQRGYVPGLIGDVTSMMSRRILRDYPFGAAFETRIARDMTEFIPRAEAPPNGIWHVSRGGRAVGSITIDGERLGQNRAHLRWFVVSDDMLGTGAGKALLRAALDHCDRSGLRETHLWTVRGLDAARRLYERNGFYLAEEYEGDQWGASVTEQKFVRPAP